MKTVRSKIGAQMVGLVCGCVLLALNGCNILAPVAYVATGPPTVDAEYALPDRPTVVFVDDLNNALGERPLRRYIGDKVAEHLMRQKILTQSKESGEVNAISSRDVLAIVSNDKHGELTPIGEIGRSVGASQVVYIEMMSFEVRNVGGRPLAQAHCRVRVLDVQAEKNVFPGEERKARDMIVNLPPEQALQPLLTHSSAREAEMTLADLVADRVAKLFYKHEPRTPLGGRSAPESAL